MGEGLLRHRLPGAEVASAGLGALVGQPADAVAIELMAERGIDLTAHRARQVTAAMVKGFELVLVMEKGHVAALEALTPAARGRVQLLGRFGGFEVHDPYRRPRAAFEEAAALIDRGIGDYLQRFGGGR